MTSVFEHIYGLIVEPAKTLGRLTREEKPVLLALIFFLVAQTLGVLLSGGSLPQQLDYSTWGNWGSFDQFEQAMSSLMAVIGLLTIGLSLLFLFIQGGLFALLAELLGGQANGKGIFVGLCFAALPGLLIAAMGAALELLGQRGMGVELFLGVVVLGWTALLQVLAIREGAETSTGKAVLIYLLPVAALIVGVIAVAAAVMLAI